MIGALFRSMRVYQWTKNLVLFAGLVFTLKVLEPEMAIAAVSASSPSPSPSRVSTC